MSDPIARLNAALQDRYRIERELGEGGMATVYLADDLKHSRKVAIKVLKAELAAVVGAERFLTEIETTANLQHPHILPLFDSGEADGFLYYVMPYVEGETLRDRLDREKQLPVDEAVGLAVSVANALEAAHQRGVVHRDIKPANILLSGGEPLVADFGIALAVGAAGGNRLTETGLSVGTPYYMSPEQATGDQTMGPATDQYSLACVLYEMLTGDPPYVGSTAQAVLGKIIQGAPTRTRQIRSSIPPNVDGAILRALERLPADRFPSARDFAAALSSPAYRYRAEDDSKGAGSRWTPLTTVFAVATVVLAALALWGWLGPEPREPVRRFYVEFPEGQELLASGIRSTMALTSDGGTLVYVGPSAGAGRQLWVRRLDRLDATPLAGTEGAEQPFLSPDDREVAYVVRGEESDELRAIPLEGGPSRLLTDSLVDGGGSWSTDGWLYYDGHLEGDGLARVRETGGTPEPVTMPTEAEQWHAAPQVIPGERGVLFYSRGGDSIGMVDLETGGHRLLVSGVGAVYAPTGHLVWLTSDGTLMAAPFDENSLSLTGLGVPLAEGLAVGGVGGMSLTLSREGTAMYVAGARQETRTNLVWADPDGNAQVVDPDWREVFWWVVPSPDGQRIAVAVEEAEDVLHIWVRSTTGGTPVRVTFEGSNRAPEWTPDGERLLYLTGAPGETGSLILRDPDVPGRGQVVLEEVDAFDLSADGEWLVFQRSDSLWAQRLGPGLEFRGEPIHLDIDDWLPDGAGFDQAPELSPDGRWLAYLAWNDGPPRVAVRPFPNVGDGRWPVSSNTSVSPMWAHDGSALWYRDWNRSALMRVPTQSASTLVLGEPEMVTPLTSPGHWRFTPAPDGSILMPAVDGQDDTRLILVQGFFRELRERVGK